MKRAGGQTIVFSPRRKRGSRQRRMAGLAPSAYWADEISAGRVRHFPPRADHAPMVQCQSHHKSCARFYPSYYVRPPEDGAASDHHCSKDCPTCEHLADVRSKRRRDACICEDCNNAFLLQEERRRRADEELSDVDAGTSDSPTTIALKRLEATDGELAETLQEPLLSEDEADLRGEIVEYFVRTCFVDDAPPHR